MNCFSLLPIITLLSTATVGSNLKPSSCAELLFEGKTKSGVYTIHSRPWYGACPVKVYCDMETDGGGWTLFHRRDDYEIQENFTREWDDYRDGFGSVERDFWLGNENLYILTNQDRVALRLDLEDFENNTRMAQYEYFHISNEVEYNRIPRKCRLKYHNGMKFATYDKDNEKKCANQNHGGLWFLNCQHTNPNGLYRRGKYSGYRSGVEWYHWLSNYSLKRFEMKVRPINFKSRWPFKE